MISISEDKIINDLEIVGELLVSCTNKNMINNNYNSFLLLNEVLINTYKKTLDIDKHIIDKQSFYDIVDKYDVKNVENIVSFMDKYQKTMRRLFNNYLNIINQNEFKDETVIRLTKKRYSEKDFKDLILSYYNTLGDKQYKIAKRYFDEGRIHMNYPRDNGNYAGFFVHLPSLYSGYVIMLYTKYNSMSAGGIVHELGHAFDSETFIFPQQKNLYELSDPFVEVPSATFEVGFYDYLVQNGIDVNGGRVLLNEIFEVAADSASDMIEIIKQKDIFIDERGIGTTKDNKEYPLRNDIVYGIGYLIALHFDLIRKNDIKEFNRLFNNFITTRKESSFEELIGKMGIDMEDFISGRLIRPIVKENSLELKKRYKIY